MFFPHYDGKRHRRDSHRSPDFSQAHSRLRPAGFPSLSKKRRSLAILLYKCRPADLEAMRLWFPRDFSYSALSLESRERLERAGTKRNHRRSRQAVFRIRFYL